MAVELKKYFPVIRERNEVLEEIRSRGDLRRLFENWSQERQDEFLSLILNQKVNLIAVLPNESARLAAESSLLIIDMVVELADGSIANTSFGKTSTIKI